LISGREARNNSGKRSPMRTKGDDLEREGSRPRGKARVWKVKGKVYQNVSVRKLEGAGSLIKGRFTRKEKKLSKQKGEVITTVKGHRLII